MGEYEHTQTTAMHNPMTPITTIRECPEKASLFRHDGTNSKKDNSIRSPFRTSRVNHLNETDRSLFPFKNFSKTKKIIIYSAAALTIIATISSIIAYLSLSSQSDEQTNNTTTLSMQNQHLYGINEHRNEEHTQNNKITTHSTTKKYQKEDYTTQNNEIHKEVAFVQAETQNRTSHSKSLKLTEIETMKNITHNKNRKSSYPTLANASEEISSTDQSVNYQNELYFSTSTELYQETDIKENKTIYNMKTTPSFTITDEMSNGILSTSIPEYEETGDTYGNTNDFSTETTPTSYFTESDETSSVKQNLYDQNETIPLLSSTEEYQETDSTYGNTDDFSIETTRTSSFSTSYETSTIKENLYDQYQTIPLTSSTEGYQETDNTYGNTNDFSTETTPTSSFTASDETSSIQDNLYDQNIAIPLPSSTEEYQKINSTYGNTNDFSIKTIPTSSFATSNETSSVKENLYDQNENFPLPSST